MLAPVRHILPLTTIRRERLLPLPGRILVRKGQKINASDQVAEANLSPQHLMMDIASGLGLSPDSADAYIQRKPGDLLSEGDLIAGPVGWAKRVVRAPRAGKVVLVGRGKILLEIDSQPFRLKAAIPGLVIALIPDRGVVVETHGALVQGVWGNGAVDTGLLRRAIQKPEDVLTPDRLEIGLRGAVVLAGYCGDLASLQAAAELPLRGLILSSMAAALVEKAAQMPFPIVVLEGFGLLPMDQVAYQLLTTHVEREVTVNGEMEGPYSMTGPEVVIPLPVSDPPPEPRAGSIFAPNKRVRVVRAPYHAQTGVILSLAPGLTLLPSGLRIQAAEVRLETGATALLPLANLEVLE